MESLSTFFYSLPRKINVIKMPTVVEQALRLPRLKRHHTRSLRNEQLDDGIVDTLVSLDGQPGWQIPQCSRTDPQHK
jgi:hypothetical protein